MRDLYKVLLVDDEAEVRHTIVEKLDWAALGFCVVGEASNGEEALDLCEQLAPDVIMTDIKMPFMDGLELCRRAKQLLPGVKTAIFSGFDEFEYAKEAIHLEVEEYILKPVNAQEMAQVFRRIREGIDKEVEERRNLEKLRRHYQQSLPLMRQQLLLSLFEGSMDAGQIDALLREYDLDLQAGQYCVAILKYEQEQTGDEAKLYPYSLQNMLEESLGKQHTVKVLQSFGRIAMLFLLPQNAHLQTVVADLNQLYVPAQKLLGLRLSVGLGRAYPALQDIARSYSEAVEAMDYQAVVGAGQCIYIADVRPEIVVSDVWVVRYVDDILRQIKIGRAEDLRGIFDELLHYLRNKQLARPQHQMLQMGLATELMKLIHDYQLAGYTGEIETALLNNTVHPFDSFEESDQFFRNICEELRMLLARQRSANTKKMVETSKQYIGEHFVNSDLSVDMLCSVLNVSPAYFSTIFKRETGESFVAYLTRMRLEKAVEYLCGTDDKAYLIAGNVGYADPNYFSYVFKKNYGVSPSKYRLERVPGHAAD